eukprot:s5046_g2.t2
MPSPEGAPAGEPGVVIGYCDASWNVASVSGGVLVYRGCCLKVFSRKQEVPALSSAEAELSRVENSKELIVIAMLIQTIMEGTELDKIGTPKNPTGTYALVLKNDSKAAISISRLRHVELRAKFIQFLVKKRRLLIEHLPGLENPSDGLTRESRDAQLHRREEELRQAHWELELADNRQAELIHALRSAQQLQAPVQRAQGLHGNTAGIAPVPRCAVRSSQAMPVTIFPGRQVRMVPTSQIHPSAPVYAPITRTTGSQGREGCRCDVNPIAPSDLASRSTRSTLRNPFPTMCWWAPFCWTRFPLRFHNTAAKPCLIGAPSAAAEFAADPKWWAAEIVWQAGPSQVTTI